MKRKLTEQEREKHVRMLSDVRDRLIDKIQALGLKYKGPLRSGQAHPFPPVSCTHDLPWTDCGRCSKRSLEPSKEKTT